MYAARQVSRPFSAHVFTSNVNCDWQVLRAQLMLQWSAVSADELDQVAPDRHNIALLIERKYGIDYSMVENYLSNFERTMPLARSSHYSAH